MINVQGSIIVTKDISTVFDYFSDLRNDKTWRKEINATSLSTARPEAGSIVTEHSFLSKRVPDYVTVLVCTTFRQNDTAVYQTQPGNPFFLQTTRKVQQASPATVSLQYQLVFSKAIVQHGLGVQLPALLVTWFTTYTLKKYLAQLKTILEQGHPLSR